MDLKYREIKEDSIDTYESLHMYANYPIRDTFYAFLNDYELSENYDNAEKISIYVAFSVLLIEKKQDFSFLKSELNKLFSKKDLEKVISVLDKEDTSQFTKDIDIINENIFFSDQ